MGHSKIKVDDLGRVHTGEVLRLTRWAPSTLWRKIKTGAFPAPTWGNKRGEARYWRLADIEKWARISD